MRRREFMAGLGAAITGSIQTNAQQLPPVSLVGYLYAGPAEGFAFRQVAFRKGLAETDYFEGCNVAIETHWARNESFRLADLAGELVGRGVAANGRRSQARRHGGPIFARTYSLRFSACARSSFIRTRLFSA